MITRGVVFVFLGGCIFCGLAVYAYNITQKLDSMIIPGIFAVILWLTAYAGYDYEKMTPEEKKKWKKEEQLRKYKRWSNRHYFWYEFLKNAKGPCDI